MKLEVVENIKIEDVKNGQYIRLKDDNKLYVVVYRHKEPILIPINISEHKAYKDEIILDVFNAKNGECIKHKMESSDE